MPGLTSLFLIISFCAEKGSRSSPPATLTPPKRAWTRITEHPEGSEVET